MALTKEAVIEKIEIVSSWNVQVATDTVIKEDGNDVSKLTVVSEYWIFSTFFIVIVSYQ